MSVEPEALLLYFLFAVVSLYTLVLYLRVEWSEWGMVGLVVFMAGVTVLALRSILALSGIREPADELLILWRSMCAIGGAVAGAGVVVSLWRDPPPPRRTAIRLAVATCIMLALFVVIDQLMTR